MDSSAPAPATTPRTAPTALLRAQNSVAALPRGRPDVLAFVTDNFHFKKRVDLYMLCGCGALRMALPATHVAALRSCS